VLLGNPGIAWAEADQADDERNDLRGWMHDLHDERLFVAQHANRSTAARRQGARQRTGLTANRSKAVAFGGKQDDAILRAGVLYVDMGPGGPVDIDSEEVAATTAGERLAALRDAGKDNVIARPGIDTLRAWSGIHEVVTFRRDQAVYAAGDQAAGRGRRGRNDDQGVALGRRDHAGQGLRQIQLAMRLCRARLARSGVNWTELDVKRSPAGDNARPDADHAAAVETKVLHGQQAIDRGTAGHGHVGFSVRSRADEAGDGGDLPRGILDGIRTVAMVSETRLAAVAEMSCGRRDARVVTRTAVKFQTSSVSIRGSKNVVACGRDHRRDVTRCLHVIVVRCPNAGLQARREARFGRQRRRDVEPGVVQQRRHDR
jgi:hypothetical protein